MDSTGKVNKEQVIRRLCALRELYNWGQLGGAVISQPVTSIDTDVFSKPCGVDLPCRCCTGGFNQDENVICDVGFYITASSPSPVTMQTPKSRRKVIIDESEDEAIEHGTKFVHTESATLFNHNEGLDCVSMQHAPVSARSKNKFIVLSDSEDESSVPIRVDNLTDINAKRRIFYEEDEATEDNSPEKSFDGEAEVVDGESIGFSGDEARSVDNSESADSDDNDWIVNSSEEEEENSYIESDLSDDDEYYQREIRAKNKENNENWIANNVPASTTKKMHATPRKAHFVDLSVSPEVSPLDNKKQLKSKTGASTPKSTKKTVPLMATPVRKISQTELNAQRVAALSTGKKKFKSTCGQLAQDLYLLYNEIIFDNRLPKDLPVIWSKRLLTTAGYCKCHKTTLLGAVKRTATIELSTKVLDDEERLRSTLIHEMCHAANFLIDELDNAQHGKEFKKWGRRATKHFPEITVSTCHSYDIHAPHKFKCSNAICGVVYSRHSKKGINVLKQFCGVCNGMLEYQGISDKDGNIAKPRQATGFSIYVKEHFARVKAELSAGGIITVSTTTIMKELGVQYRAEKEAFSNDARTRPVLERVEVDLVSDTEESNDQEVEQDGVDELYEQLTALVL